MRKKHRAIILTLILIFTLLCGTIVAAATEKPEAKDQTSASAQEVQTEAGTKETADEAAETAISPADDEDLSEEIGEGTIEVAESVSQEPAMFYAAAAQQANPVMVIIGDSYAYGMTSDGSLRPGIDSWAYQVLNRIGAPGSVVSCYSGAGFTQYSDGWNFANLLYDSVGRTTPWKVNLVIIAGDYNDQWYDQGRVYNDAVNTINLAKSLYPNAKIMIAPIGWQKGNTAGQNRIRNISIPAYRNAAYACGAEYWYGGEYILANVEDENVFDWDTVHPNLKGQNILRDAFLRKLQGGNEKNKITVRYHINNDAADSNIVEKTYYANGGGRLDQPTAKKGQQFAGWSFYRYAGNADYPGGTPIANDWIYTHAPTIDLYGVWNDDLSGTGIKRYAGALYWVVNGKPQTGFTGFATYNGDMYRIVNGKVSTERTVAYNPQDGNWYYTNNGKVDLKRNSVEQNENGWWKITNGKVDFGFNGMAENENGWWKITGGKVDFGFRGFEKNQYGWWYLDGGHVNFDKNDVMYGRANNSASKKGEDGWWLVRGSFVQNTNTVAMNSNGWWKITNGKVDFGFNGMAENENGWWKITGGQVDFGFRGFEKNQYGWWYLDGGHVNFDRNDVMYGRANNSASKKGEDGWWLVRGSFVQNTNTVACNSNGWWKITNGKVDFGFNGMAENENGWWKITGGQVDFGFRGFEKNQYGWWYLDGGHVNFDKNDVMYGRANNSASKKGEDGWWLVRGSFVQNTNTVAMNSNGWWKITNGKVDFGFTGFERNENGWWYLKGGHIDFSISGTFKGTANVSPSKAGVSGKWKVKYNKVVKKVS